MAVDADPAPTVTELVPGEESGESDGQAVDADLRVGDETAAADWGACRRGGGLRPALLVGLAGALMLTGVGGWLGYLTYQSYQAGLERRLFVQVARQAAVNLTTISYTEADADMRRVLDSSTGAFRDDFQRRSQPFIEVVKQAQAKSEGTVTEAGLESEQGDTAQVLVAVAVKTSTGGTQDPQPRMWRMRIAVQRVADGAKVSNVSFVP